jgi:hypothetical protein
MRQRNQGAALSCSRAQARRSPPPPSSTDVWKRPSGVSAALACSTAGTRDARDRMRHHDVSTALQDRTPTAWSPNSGDTRLQVRQVRRRPRRAYRASSMSSCVRQLVSAHSLNKVTQARLARRFTTTQRRCNSGSLRRSGDAKRRAGDALVAQRPRGYACTPKQ